MKHLLLILLSTILSNSIHAFGIGDWIYHTNNGSSIEDPGGGITLWINHTNAQVSNLSKWYFYSNHIIGEYDTFINPEYKTAYFILNELNGELKTYNSKELFEKDIQVKELKPLFWTRWYYDHFTLIQMIYILWLFYWHIELLFVLLTCTLIFLSIRLKNKFLKVCCTVLTSMLLLPPLLSILSDYFTSSI
ncbi:MAG TPA: hypothetical protein VK796_07215 [Cytophaga sp.]|jgi:hypothetical protein|nr:hypothetical protein [Cytophaga sp.]